MKAPTIDGAAASAICRAPPVMAVTSFKSRGPAMQVQSLAMWALWQLLRDDLGERFR